MPEFRNIVPVLRVADLARAVGFYTKTLGFVVVWQAANDGGGENAMLRPRRRQRGAGTTLTSMAQVRFQSGLHGLECRRRYPGNCAGWQ
jgi:catechol 2,3-dioxygenase-like lactoylglutathione lyase family enzyme